MEAEKPAAGGRQAHRAIYVHGFHRGGGGPTKQGLPNLQGNAEQVLQVSSPMEAREGDPVAGRVDAIRLMFRYPAEACVLFHSLPDGPLWM